MKVFVTLLLFFISVNVMSQTATSDTTQVKSDSLVFIPVEITAQYPGGVANMMKFIQNNQKYPREAWKSGIEGDVRVVFIVEKDGSISNPTVAKSVHPTLDAEAIRVIKMMPNWIPGKVRNQPVKSQFSIPIRFRKS